jgi:lipopolysaccharide/colanic/teichoic acid biosynthesis glycosyltransferase
MASATVSATVCDQPLYAVERASALRPLHRTVFDWTITACLLLILAVPFLIIAVAIKLDSPGPVFFRQPRVGLHNRVFKVWKFRSMHHHGADITGSQLTRRNDPRITRVGAWLRKTSLDEAPQLFNVLLREMALVGPRPHPLNASAGGILYHEAVPDYALRHRVLPGITGWAQINGWRGETERLIQIEQRVRYDLEYIERQSLLFDVKILLLTPLRLSGKHVF